MANPTCPTNCAAPLPVMSFNEFCDPEFNPSEIQYLLIAKGNATPIANLNSAAEWQARISNTSTDANAIRKVIVIGDIPAPAEQEFTGSMGRKKVLSRTNTLNFDIDETSDTTYNAFRQMQCGAGYMVWVVTKSGHLLGGTTGVGEGKPVSVKFNFLFNRGDAEVQKINGVATWDNLFAPERNKWVLASSIGGGSTSFDSTLTFSTATTDSEDGVSGTVSATNSVQKFEFVGILSPAGTANSMTINVGGSQVASIDFPSDYAGTPFRYTHTNGTQYTGTFVNDTVNF